MYGDWMGGMEVQWAVEEMCGGKGGGVVRRRWVRGVQEWCSVRRCDTRRGGTAAHVELQIQPAMNILPHVIVQLSIVPP